MTVPVAWLPAKLLTDLHKPGSHVGIRTVAYRVCRSDTMQPLYTQDQLDAAVRAEREACAHIARLRGSEANRLFKDHVQPVKNMIQRDEAFAIATAIRARG